MRFIFRKVYEVSFLPICIYIDIYNYLLSDKRSIVCGEGIVFLDEKREYAIIMSFQKGQDDHIYQ